MNDDYDVNEAEEFGDGFEFEQPHGTSADGEEFDAEDFSLESPGDGMDGLDSEADAFFKKAFRAVGRGLKKINLRKLAPLAGRIAGGFIGGPIGAKIGGQLGGMLREDEAYEGFDSESFDFEEFDGEDEDGEETLREDAPQALNLDLYTDGLAEELAAAAADSESDAEAAALLGGVTVHIMSRAPITVKRLAPVVVRSSARLQRALRRSPSTRPLVRTIPTIQRRAVKMLNRQARRNARMTPQTAKKAMAKATYQTLRSPGSAAKGLANNAVKKARVQRINKRAVLRAERQQVK